MTQYNSISIILSDLRFFARIGVFEQERMVGNEFSVTLEIEVPVTQNMLEDKIEGTVSYADIYEVVKEVMMTEAQTLEYVVLTITRCIKSRWPNVIKGRISLYKLTPPIAGIVGSAAVTHKF